MGVVDDKRALRTLIRSRLMAQDDSSRRRASDAVMQRLLPLIDAVFPHPIAFFASMPMEVDTTALDAHLRRRAQPRVLPRIASPDLVFHVVPTQTSIGDMPVDAWKIPAPSPTWASVSLRDVGLIVVPTLAIDDDGFRLGHGKGYYDRALSTVGVDGPPTVVVAFDAQCVTRVPRETHDRAVAIVVTPSSTRVIQGVPDPLRSAIPARR